jgi:hypothetical protein
MKMNDVIMESNLKLPYDSSCPVLYDNDEATDVYTDELLMAYASVGEIQLKGFITSSSVKPYNRFVSETDFCRMVCGRLEGMELALKSGFANVPEHYLGTRTHLKRPVSERIEDTIPLDSEGSRKIIEIAREASPEKPLVIVMGGPLTAAADAYLLDNTIADRVVVTWLGGTLESMGDYNGWADEWAAYIVLEKLRLVVFPFYQGRPIVNKINLWELPDTLTRHWMINKFHKWAKLPWDADDDGQPVISILRDDYVTKLERVGFGGWMESDGHRIPLFKKDPNGKALLVMESSEEVATREWWRAMKNPVLWEKYHRFTDNLR